MLRPSRCISLYTPTYLSNGHLFWFVRQAVGMLKLGQLLDYCIPDLCWYTVLVRTEQFSQPLLIQDHVLFASQQAE